jgi:hypothetical protein
VIGTITQNENETGDGYKPHGRNGRKTAEKRYFGRIMGRWENITMELNEIKCGNVCLICLDEESNKPLGSIKGREFLEQVRAK